MNTSSIENIPQVWDDARDGVFFRLTADVLSSQFCAGASVLLASYDSEAPATEPAGTVAPAISLTAPAAEPARPRPAQLSN